MSEAKDRAQVSAYFEDPYPELSELMPVDLISFAYQIASGMVSWITLAHSVYHFSLVWVHSFTYTHSCVL